MHATQNKCIHLSLKRYSKNVLEAKVFKEMATTKRKSRTTRHHKSF